MVTLSVTQRKEVGKFHENAKKMASEKIIYFGTGRLAFLALFLGFLLVCPCKNNPGRSGSCLGNPRKSKKHGVES